MLDQVRAFIRQNGLFSRGDAVVVACSGGPDSLALLDVLCTLKDELGISLRAAHFDHQIRGRASREDALFVRSFCEARDIPCVVGEGDVPAYARRTGLSIETAAREMRYDFLYRTLGEGDLLATAHHRGDQAETVLLHLLRGSGIDGLGAMRPRDGRLVRPFLSVTKGEILRYIESRGLTPRYDATNDDVKITRNRLRHVIFPLLLKENPALETSLAQLAIIARDESDCLEATLDARWGRLFDGEAMLFEPFSLLPVALQRRAIRRFLRDYGLQDGVGFTHVESVRCFFLSGRTGKLSLPHDHYVCASYGRLLFCSDGEESEPQLPVVLVSIPGKTIWGEYVLTATILDGDFPDGLSDCDFLMDAAGGDGFTLRSRREGDWIDIGGGHLKKLKNLFIDAKIPAGKRDYYPLLARGSEVLWVPGVRRSSHFPAKKGSKTLFFHMDTIK